MFERAAAVTVTVTATATATAGVPAKEINQAALQKNDTQAENPRIMEKSASQQTA